MTDLKNNKRIEIISFAKELALIVSIGAIAWAVLYYFIYPAYGLPQNAPYPARTLIEFFLVWILIRRKKEIWKDFGLKKPNSIGITVLLVIGYLIFAVFVLQPFADSIKELLNLKPADTSFFAHIKGNVPAYLSWVILAWGIGAFCEELIFRGYLMNRVASLFHNSKIGWTVALFAQAFIFGLGHSYLGYTAIITVGIPALGLGALYLLAGKNLWPVILVHGIWDTLGFTLLFFNGVPST